MKILFTILFLSYSLFANATVIAPKMDAPMGTIVAPIDVSSDEKFIMAADFNLTYDDELIRPFGRLSSNFGCTSSGIHIVNCNVSNSGTLRISTYCPYGLPTDGTLMYVTFYSTRFAEAEDESGLDFSVAQFYGISGEITTGINAGYVKLY